MLARRTETFARRLQGAPYNNITPVDALSLKGANVVTALDKHAAQAAAPLLERGAVLVCHDPTELPVVTNTAPPDTPVVVIRPVNVQTFVNAGFNAVYTPHPYCAVTVKAVKTNRAVSISRLDFDKNIHLVCEANLALAEPVHIWGAENRLYTHHRLTTDYPDWRRNYRGRFPARHGAGAALAARYRFVVDLSTIHLDGGGTQYTFLEAYNAGSVLVVNRAWLRRGGVLVEGQNCLAVDDAPQLVDVLCHPPDVAPLLAGGRTVLQRHAPGVVVPAFLEAAHLQNHKPL